MFPFSGTATSWLPSLDMSMNHQLSGLVKFSSVQVPPPSLEVQMFPASTTAAASLLPVVDMAMVHHFLGGPAVVTSDQVAPPSSESQRLPLWNTAASLLPSADMAMEDQKTLPVGSGATSVQT